MEEEEKGHSLSSIGLCISIDILAPPKKRTATMNILLLTTIMSV
jgi:hypothetical protein